MRCGFYETEITPPLGTAIFGYFIPRINDKVTDKLYAKACVLEQDGKYCAMLVLDALKVPPAFPAFIQHYVREKTGIAPDSLLITATHSHTAFPIEDDLGIYDNPRFLEKQPRVNAQLDRQTMDMIRILSVDAVVHAFRRLQPVRISFGTGEAKGISYVREYYLEDGTVRTNPIQWKDQIVKPYSQPDTSLPVFFFTDEAGKPVGSIASFALHHDIISGSQISADYSGVVSRKMKEKYGNDFVSMFFAGFCGNINHANYMGEKVGEPFVKTYEQTGCILFDAIVRTVAQAQPVNPELEVRLETATVKKRQLPEGFIESVEALVKDPPSADTPSSIEDPYSDGMKYLASGRLLSYYGVETDKLLEVPVQVIRIGDCLIYALPGEMFSQFADKLRSASPTRKNMFVEFANYQDCPYVPTKELFLPFVYESSYYSARWEPDAGDILTDKALEIARKLM